MAEKYDYLTGKGEPTGIDTANEITASFVPGLNVAQALRDYKKAVEENDTVGKITSALGLVPGMGAAAKTALMVGALRKPVYLSRSAKSLPDLASKSDLYAPSIQTRHTPPGTPTHWGDNHLIPSEDMILSGKYPMDIFDRDAATSMRGPPDALKTHAFNTDAARFKSFKDFMGSDNPIVNDPSLSPKFANYGEIKLRSPSVQLSPENFPGVMHPPGADSGALGKLRSRGLQTLEVPPNASPEELRQMYEYIQGLRK